MTNRLKILWYLIFMAFLGFSTITKGQTLRSELNELTSHDQVQVQFPQSVHDSRNWLIPPQQISQGNPQKTQNSSQFEEDKVSFGLAAPSRPQRSSDQNSQTIGADELLKELESESGIHPTRSQENLRHLWNPHLRESESSQRTFRSRSR